MSKKPTAVEKAAAEAERLHNEIYNAAPPADTSTVDGEHNAPAPVTTPPAAATDGSATSSADNQTPPTQTAHAPGTAAYWEHKYNTLRGMFNKDVPRLNSLVAELRLQAANYENIIDDLKKQLEAKPVAAPAKLLNDEDVENYGEGMISVIQRAAQEAVAGDIAELKRQNQELMTQNLQLRKSLGTVNAVTEKNARQQVFDALSEQVPDWQAINESAEFLEWLKQRDAFSGKTRQEMLDVAFGALDAQRVVAFFEAFANEQSLTARRTIDPAGTETAPTVRLDTLAGPGKPQRSQSSQVVSETSNEIWTQEKIAAFYSDCARGAYKSRPEERMKIERRIHRAVNEGRVR